MRAVPLRGRWWAIVAVRLAGMAGAVLGLLLIGRAPGWGPRILGGAIILSSLVMTASVTGALARRWRSDP